MYVLVFGLLVMSVCGSNPTAWPPDNGTQSVGNHRYSVTVSNTSAVAIEAVLHWYRRDNQPATKGVYVLGGQPPYTHVKCRVLTSNYSMGRVVFHPIPSITQYHVYYLPFYYTNHQYAANVVYEPNTVGCAAPSWWPPGAVLPQASVGQYESKSPFHAFTPMERGVDPALVGQATGAVWMSHGEGVVVTDACANIGNHPAAGITVAHCQDICLTTIGCNAINVKPGSDCVLRSCTTGVTTAHLSGYTLYTYLPPSTLPQPTLTVVPEDRSNITRMLHMVPQHWLPQIRQRSMTTNFKGTAQPGEHYTYQLCVYCPGANGTIATVSNVVFSDLTSTNGNTIHKSTQWCMNTNGRDYWGRVMDTKPTVNMGQVLPLWMAIDIPLNTTVGTYNGHVTVKFTIGNTDIEVHTVNIQIHVSGTPLPDGGDSDPYRGTRATWLDSIVGLDDTVTAPYTPLVVSKVPSGIQVNALDKRVVIDIDSGLPATITTESEGASRTKRSISVLQQSIHFPLGVGTLHNIQHTTITHSGASLVSWITTLGVTGGCTGMTLNVVGSMDYTGYLDYIITINNTLGTTCNVNTSLVVPMNPTTALYTMGWGRKASRTTPYSWKWNHRNKDSAVWSGCTRGGLRLYLRGPEDMWQASIPHDNTASVSPLPSSWYNNGLGGATITSNKWMVAQSGARSISHGETLSFHFSITITPLKPIDWQQHWANRYLQVSGATAANVNFTALKADGVTVVNLHQGSMVNPWINYPYLTVPWMTKLAKEAHSVGVKLKIYDTMRELSNRAVEMFHMLAFGGTVLPGKGLHGAAWLQEHIQYDYNIAWSTPLPDGELDAAVEDSGLSRWNNYYVRGLQYLVNTAGIDGVYLDEIAYDRVTMKRVRRVLSSDNRGALIDVHSDQGFVALSPALGYMELFPFVDSLWFGEGFDYSSPADYWLVELSGIPLGLTADMLRYTGMEIFPFRGLLFGEAMRKGCDPKADPTALWHLWDKFGVANSTLYGWWDVLELGENAVPVTSSNPDVKVSTYFINSTTPNARRALVAVASFAVGSTTTRLTIQWSMLGIDKEHAVVVAPHVDNVQPGTTHTVDTDRPLTVPHHSGVLLMITVTL